MPRSINTGPFWKLLRTDTLVLPNRDLDSGNLTKAAEYSLTDETYAKLLTQLSDRQYRSNVPRSFALTFSTFTLTSRCQSRPKKIKVTGAVC